MPKVPYEPYPTAQPSAPGERISESTPGAAFGENIGEAIRGLGTAAQQGGEKLFQTALSLQELQNQNDARAAQTDYATQSSQLHADFGALTGKAAADALPGFLAKQKQLREDIRGKLQSPMAREMYDADSLPFMQRNIFSAAGHAADQNKQFTLDTDDSSLKMSIQQAAMHPQDEPYVEGQRAIISQKATDYAQLKYGTNDPNDPNVKLYRDNALSSQRAEQILGMLKTGDYVGAGQMEQKYKDDLTNPQDRDRVVQAVEYKGATVVSGNVAASILKQHRQPDGTFDVSVAQMQDQAREMTKGILPDNGLAPEMAAQKIDGLSYSGRVAARIDQQDANKKFIDTITQFNVHDTQSLLALPDGPKIVEALAPKQRANLQATINDFWKGSDRISSQESLRIINGMRTGGTQEQLADFMAINPSDPKWHLSTDDQIKVQNWQYEAAKKPSEDPRVALALGVLRGARGAELQALGVYNRDRNNPDDYDHFVGALQESLQIWQEDHGGKRPTNAEIQDVIGPEIIKTQASRAGFWSLGGYGTTTQEPAFRQFNRANFEDIPEDWKTRVVNEVKKSGGVEPTDEQLIQAYTRMQFNLLYKQSKPSGE